MAEARIYIYANGTPTGNWVGTSDPSPDPFTIDPLLDWDTGADLGWQLDATEILSVGAALTGPSSCSGDAAWVDQSAVSEGFYRFDVDTKGYDFTFSGLNDAKTYTIEIFGGRDASGHILQTTIGADTRTLETGGNTTEIIQYSGISPSSGAIDLNCTRQNSGGQAALNAMRIIEDESGAQPPFVSVTVTG